MQPCDNWIWAFQVSYLFSNNYIMFYTVDWQQKTILFLCAEVLACFFLRRNWTDGKCRWTKGYGAKLLHRHMLKCMHCMVKFILVLHAVNHLQRLETTTTCSAGHARSIFVPCAISLSQSRHSTTVPKVASNIRLIPEWGFFICGSIPSLSHQQIIRSYVRVHIYLSQDVLYSVESIFFQESMFSSL